MIARLLRGTSREVETEALAPALARLPLPPRDRRLRVAVVGEADSEQVAAVRATLPEADVVVVPAPGLQALERALRRHGPLDLVLDLDPPPVADQAHRVHRLVLHLAPGGVYAVVAATAGGGEVAAVLAELDLPEPPAGTVRRLARLARHHVDDELPGAVLEEEVLLKLRHAHATSLIDRRPGPTRVTELATLPAGDFRSRTAVTFHGPQPREVPDAVLSHPALPLRRYDGDVLLQQGGLATTDGVVLPDSFRWHLAPRLEHHRLVDVGPGFARLKSPPVEADVTRLEGSYFHFDYVHSGHYGHLMTEAVAKLWGWPLAKAADPDLRLLSRIHPRLKGDDRPTPDLAVLEGFGVARDDIVRVHGDVRVESLVAAAPMWHNHDPFHVHPQVVEVWDRLRLGLADPDAATPERIFVSRRDGNRRCRNVREVEMIFEEAGYEVVLPGGLTQAEQATVFAGARVVAGFGGTGMFNLAYAHRAEHVLVLNQDAYDARNEHLFAAAHGADIDYLISPADLAHPEDGWSYEAFQASWSFDLERHRDVLRDLLADWG